MSYTEEASGHVYHDIINASAQPGDKAVTIELQRQEGGRNTSTFGGKMTPEQAVALANALLAAAASANS